MHIALSLCFWGVQTISNQHKYKAFISYAHSNEAQARRIHKALETYSLPKGMAVEQKLKPIFRDVTELSAHHSLSEKITEAIKASEFLIVLCSPEAKASHWVNQEINVFREIHGPSRILSVIIDGDPQSAFPLSLIDNQQEPLAADMTKRAGFSFGISQLVASLLGVGLDDLLQRETIRRKRKARLITTAALSFAAVMTAISWFAIDARKQAEISRTEAEKMVEYLITDLKVELASVGRLGILDHVGQRVTTYYQAIPMADMNDARLSRQARSRHILGEVAVKQGLTQRAFEELGASYEATQELLKRSPNSPDAIFAHAQSEYWIGKVHLEQEQYEKALPYREAYNQLSERLYTLEPTHLPWVYEYGWAQNNLGLLKQKMNDLQSSEEHFHIALSIFETALSENPNNEALQFEIIAVRKNLARTQSLNNKIEPARESYTEQIKALETILLKNPNDANVKDALLMAKIRLKQLIITYEQTCQKEPLIDIISQMETLLALDPSNYEWAHRYPTFLHFFLTHCQDSFEQQWINKKITYLMQLTSDTQYLDPRIIVKRDWLKAYVNP